MLNFIIGPAIRLSRTLSFQSKFLLIFTASILPGLLLLLNSLLADLAFIERDEMELAGKRFISALTPVSRAMSDHRTSTALALNGDEGAKTQAQADAGKVEQRRASAVATNVGESEFPRAYRDDWSGV